MTFCLNHILINTAVHYVGIFVSHSTIVIQTINYHNNRYLVIFLASNQPLFNYQVNLKTGYVYKVSYRTGFTMPLLFFPPTNQVFELSILS